MIDGNFVDDLIDDFFGQGRVDTDSLNEIAAALADSDDGKRIWRRLLDGSAGLQDPGKREALAIAVFELLAEPPVSPLWLEALPELLASPRLYWVVCLAYRHNKADLLKHLEMLRTECDNG